MNPHLLSVSVLSVPATSRPSASATFHKGGGRERTRIHCRSAQKDACLSKNAQMSERMLHKYAEPDDASLEMLRLAMEKLSLSARAYSRILKVARTIADLEGSEKVQSQHIAEAIGYRNLDRGDWAECMAVLNASACRDVAHDAAALTVTSDACIGKDNVLHRGTLCEAEETLATIKLTVLINADAADGMVLSVEDAAEGWLLVPMAV